MSQYRRLKYPGATYFFTVVTYQRKKLFHLPEAREMLRNAIQSTRAERPFTIDAWVLMPEHLHTIWQMPDDDNDFSARWAMIKSRFSKQAKLVIPSDEPQSNSRNKRNECQYWQRRFWEHMIRDDKEYEIYMDYTHYNPVKHGYVNQVKDWPYSTFHRCVKQNLYPENWGSVEISEEGAFGE